MRASVFQQLEEDYLNPPEDDQDETREDTRDGSEWDGFEYPD